MEEESSDQYEIYNDEGSNFDESPSESSQDDDPADDSLHCFCGHTGPVFAVAWNPSLPGVVATGGGDDRAFIWKTGTENFDSIGDSTHELQGHGETVACLEFNSTGTLLASGDLEGQVRVWNVVDAECKHSFDGPMAAIESLSWHPKGDVLLAGSEDFTVWMWNATSGARMQVFVGHSGPVTCAIFTPDGKKVVSGSGDASLRVWDPVTGTCALSVSDTHNYHSAGITVLKISSDSLTACSGSEDATARLVNLQSGRVLGTLAGHTDSVEGVAFLPDTDFIATCSVDGSLRIWHASSLALRSTASHQEAIISFACHPSLPYFITGSIDGAVKCWDTRSGQCLREFCGHSQGVQALAVSPQGTFVLSGSDDGSARVFPLDLPAA